MPNNSTMFKVQGLSEQTVFLLSETIKQWQPYEMFPEKCSLSAALQVYLGAVNTQFIYLIALWGLLWAINVFCGKWITRHLQ